MKKTLLLTIVLLITNVTYGQWSKGKNKGYYKLSAWSLNTDQYYNNSGDIISNPSRTQFNINAYAEYGISDKVDLIGYVPFYAKVDQGSQSVSSLGDIDLGINYGFYKKGRWAASAKLLFGLPTGNEAGGTNGSLQTGDGEFNQFLSGALGYSTQVGGFPLYAKTYFGYNNRTKDFSDELRYGLESGINLLNKKAWLIARLDVVHPLNNGNFSNPNTVPGSIFGNNVGFIGIGIEANYYITEKIGLSLGYIGAADGRNIAANPTVNGGIFIDIK
ncbi:MAG: hypothetical protein JXR05_02515 [Flavobacteriaceae bacterium]